MTWQKWSDELKRIYLIRHGETDWNVEGRWQGNLDVPLGEIGHQQAQALAQSLKDRPITAIYSSDLMRAWKTAESLAQAKEMTSHRDARLRELNLGVFQGLTHEEIRMKYSAEDDAMAADYMDYVVPEGESRRAMQERAFEIWHEIVAREPGPEIAVFSHGGTIRMLLMKLFPEEMERLTKVRIFNTSVTTIDTDGQTLYLVDLANVAHLDGFRHGDSP
jgi:alpha-ribazole phosphatase